MNNSIRDKLQPEDFQTHSHYWDTFGNNETEESAYWVVLFLKRRTAILRDSGIEPTNGWESFTYDDLNKFYQAQRNNNESSFRFNHLITIDNDSPLKLLKAGSNGGWYPEGKDEIEVTDWFICRLASSPKMFKKT